MSARRVQSLRARGAIRPVVPGVDLVGAAEFTPQAAARAGLLRGGDGAALGERTALEWRAVLPADLRTITVWVPRSARSNGLHLTTQLPVSTTGRPAVIALEPSRMVGDAELVRGVPTASVADAIVALAAAAVQRDGFDRTARSAARAARRDCRKAWNEADFRGLLMRERIRDAVQRRHGGADLVAELQRESPLVGENAKLLSRPERRLLSGLVRRGIEPPCINAEVEIGGRIEYPDFFYVFEQLALEVDGGGHDHPGRQIKDVHREERLRRQGIPTLRFSDTEVRRDLEACLDEIERELDKRRSALS